MQYTYTKTITKDHMSINDMIKELDLQVAMSDNNTPKNREMILFSTLQELANLVIMIKKELS